MKIKIQFPYDSQMAEKLGQHHWTETFTPEEFAQELNYRQEGNSIHITYVDVIFELEKVKETDKKIVFRAERVWY